MYSLLQEQLIPNAAWKDYSANTNYAFEPFENDDKYNSTLSTAPPRYRPHSAPLRPTDPPPPRPNSNPNHNMGSNGHGHNSNGHKMPGNGHHIAQEMVQNGQRMPGNGHRSPNGRVNGNGTTGRMTPKHANSAAQYYHETRSLQRPRGQGQGQGQGQYG